jgi:hypothetical protein
MPDSAIAAMHETENTKVTGATDTTESEADLAPASIMTPNGSSEFITETADTTEPGGDLAPVYVVMPNGSSEFITVPNALPGPCGDPARPPASMAAIPWLGSRSRYALNREVYVWQQWDAYGDVCLYKYTQYYPSAHGVSEPLLIRTSPLAPSIIGRSKLTREYQEIMLAVAQKMDASFLRPIFDKYNSHSGGVAPRERAVTAREREVEQAAGAIGAALREREQAVIADEREIASLAADLDKRETELVESQQAHIRMVEAFAVSQQKICNEHASHVKFQYDQLTIRADAVNERLHAVACIKETNAKRTADMIARAETDREAASTFRAIAQDTHANVNVPPEYRERLRAAIHRYSNKDG